MAGNKNTYNLFDSFSFATGVGGFFVLNKEVKNFIISRIFFCEAANPAKRARGSVSRACICSKAGNA